MRLRHILAGLAEVLRGEVMAHVPGDTQALPGEKGQTIEGRNHLCFSAVLLSRNEEFGIAFSAHDGRSNDTDDMPFGNGSQPARDVIADVSVDSAIANDAGARDRFAAGLELRLDKRDEKGAGTGERERRREGQFQRYEADIAHDQVRLFSQVGSMKIAGIQPFQKLDSRVISQ